MAEQAGTTGSPWLGLLGRVGHIANGVIYLLVGLMAARAAIGERGRITNYVGAMQETLTQPLGMLLLSLWVVGLGAYVLWLLGKSLMPRGPEEGARSIARRLSHATTGLVYGSIAYTGLTLLTGASVEASDDAAEGVTASLLTIPLGPWIIGFGGVIILGYGGYQLYQALTASFRGELNLTGVERQARIWVVSVGRIGLTARAVLYGVIGLLLLQAAWLNEPEKTAGIRDALATLSDGPFGAWALGLVGAGLMAYGIYQLAKARYRHFESEVTPD